MNTVRYLIIVQVEGKYPLCFVDSPFTEEKTQKLLDDMLEKAVYEHQNGLLSPDESLLERLFELVDYDMETAKIDLTEFDKLMFLG